MSVYYEWYNAVSLTVQLRPFYHRDKELPRMMLRRFKLILLNFFVFSAIHDCETHMNRRSSCLMHLDEVSLCPLLNHFSFRLKLGDRWREGVGRQREIWNSGIKIQVRGSFFSQLTFLLTTLKGFLTAWSSLHRSLSYNLTNLLFLSEAKESCSFGEVFLCHPYVVESKLNKFWTEKT